MLIQAIAALFKYKIVNSIIILACWPAFDQMKIARQFTKYDMRITVSCDLTAMKHVHPQRFQGVLHFVPSDVSLMKVKPMQFSHWYKWVIVGNCTPDSLRDRTRYDVDMVYIKTHQTPLKSKYSLNTFKEIADVYLEIVVHSEAAIATYNCCVRVLRYSEIVIFTEPLSVTRDENEIFIDDVYIHPRDGISVFPWAIWSKSHSFRLTHDRQRILRRLNLNQYPIRIAAPFGYYSEDTYNGTFQEYARDLSKPEQDPGTRSGYGVAALLIEAINASLLNIKGTIHSDNISAGGDADQSIALPQGGDPASEVLIGTELWGTDINNSSMLLMLNYETAELGGAILRVLHSRVTRIDFIVHIWTFHVGFTYLAERESSSNMYLEPFTAPVWWATFALVLMLAFTQRLMAKQPVEKEGAYVAVLATYLQQDASAVPEGASGRWTFLVLSIYAMLIHAYYTSAIVSALMNSGMGGPDSLSALADSRYAISSEDIDYIRFLIFDVDTKRDDLEYLKSKKKTSTFYQDIERGVQLVQEGDTAYHTEFNQLYPRLKIFTDDQICRLKYVDTIPETRSYVTSNKRGQYTEVFRSLGRWLHEIGIADRLYTRLKLLPPPCRAALLAERVKFGDVASLIVLSVLGVVSSVILLGIEMFFAKWNKAKKRIKSANSTITVFSLD